MTSTTHDGETAQLTADVAVFHRDAAGVLRFLVVKRRYAPYAGHEALPGLYLHTTAGQVSYHLSPHDLDLFGHVPVEGATSITAWDGHDKPTAMQRLRHLAQLETDRNGS